MEAVGALRKLSVGSEVGGPGGQVVLAPGESPPFSDTRD